MKKAITHSIGAVVIVSAMFGLVGGGSAGADCLRPGPTVCYEVGPGALLTVYDPSRGVAAGVVYNDNGQTGVMVLPGNGMLTGAILHCRDNTYYLAYGVNTSSGGQDTKIGGAC